MQVLDQFGPFNSGFHVKQAAFAVKAQNALQASRINQDGAVGKLLATQGVASTRDRDGFARQARRTQNVAAVVD